MKVLIVNTSERIGGAAVAASRLMEALNRNGIVAKMVVRDKQTNNPDVIKLPATWRNRWRFVWERVVIWRANCFKKHNLFFVDIANTGADITSMPEFIEADVIHLHWINQGMLSLRSIKKIMASGKRVVWTMHDMWAFTGMCHHAGECERYMTQCHNCQYLYNGGSDRDLSWQTFRRKERLYSGEHIAFVACSHWLESLAKKSFLLHGQYVTAIPNPIDTEIFHREDKVTIREKLNLPQDKKLLLFGSVKITDKRKGIDYFVDACRIFIEKYPEMSDHVGVVLLGHSSEMENMFPFPVYAMGYVSNECEIVNIYNAVDLYVTPSLEENLPNTIMEAMACGTPCVGFNVGGIPQMIDHMQNGYVATYKSASDFADGIHWILTQSDYPNLSKEARRKVATNYTESIIAKQYIDIYNNLNPSL